MSAPDELGRTLAQFFFEIGYGACFADVMVANDMEPPFDLLDQIIERAWTISGESYEDPQEFDQKLALTEAAPDLLEALETFAAIFDPAALVESGLSDSRYADVYRLAAPAIARARGEA